MKARLTYIGNSYQLLLCNGAIKKVSLSDARRFIETYDSELHYAGTGKWAYGDITMDDYGGMTVARVTDAGVLEIESPEHFRIILYAEDIKYLTPEEYGEKVGKKRAIISRFCNEGRIPGAKKMGSHWMIPEHAPYPDDGRLKSTRSQSSNI